MKKSIKVICWIQLVFIFLFLLSETSYLNNKNIFYQQITISELVVGSLGILLLLVFFPHKAKNTYFRIFLSVVHIILIITTLFFCLAEASIVNFSGMGFGVEVAYHFEWDAFILGIKEYLVPMIIFCLVLIIFIVCIFKLTRPIDPKLNWAFLIISIVLLFFSYEATILGRIHKGLSEYIDAKTIPSANLAEVNKFQSLGIKASSLLKDNIVVTKGNNKNIILIYLESFSDIFTTSEKFPDLTPNINRLKKHNITLDNYYSSANFTMDGLISSNCGFIPNMATGNSSMSMGIKPFYLFPCASDVLNMAGYYQEFLGGAKKRFAGKEGFLLDHGFDKVWGWEDFKDLQEYKDKHSWWGLHDEDMFAFALNRIDYMQHHQPYSLNILSLSTHLKGFASPSCKKYQNKDDRYLDAIFCTDQLLGRFIEELRLKNVLKTSIIIITGDHGVFDANEISNLFGNNIDRHKLLGIIISDESDNIKRPLALYDLGSMILDLLKIQHNAIFIYASGLKKSVDKIIFRRNEYFYDNQWQLPDRNCNVENNDFNIPLNMCELQKIIKTVYGYSSLFNWVSGIKYNQSSMLTILYNKDETKIIDVRLKGKSILNKIRRDGFILEPYLLARKGVFLIVFNTQKNLMLNPLSFGVGDQYNMKIKNVIEQYENSPYMFFSNKHDESLHYIQTLKGEYKLNCKSHNECYSNNFNSNILNIQKKIQAQ